MDTLIPNDQLAPDFTLEDLDGALHSLRDYRVRIVVVNFWSAARRLVLAHSLIGARLYAIQVADR